MKKKLLITLGDSFTEGVGCWDYSLLSEETITYINNWPIDKGSILHNSKSKYIHDIKESEHKNNFHLKGWPNKLGKKLKFDKVVNLGNAGDSNSSQAKKFYQKYINKDLTNWDVCVVWLLTFPGRFSFYMGDGIRSYQLPEDSKNEILSEYYYKELVNRSISSKYQNQSDYFIELSTNLESNYYLNTVETLCKLKGFSIYSFMYDSDCIDDLKKVCTANSLIDTNPTQHPNRPKYERYGKSKLCGHFNEDGYEHMANNMYQILCERGIHIGKNENDFIEWEWDGSPVSTLLI